MKYCSLTDKVGLPYLYAFVRCIISIGLLFIDVIFLIAFLFPFYKVQESNKQSASTASLYIAVVIKQITFSAHI